MTLIIANMTTKQFMVCDSVDTKKFTNLFAKSTDKFLPGRGESFWRRTDQIVYCPPHLEKYVRDNYGQVFV